MYEDEKKGQYFTDPAVVNFMLKQVGYTPEEIIKRLKNESEDKYVSIADPSCGSGTFLYSAVDQIIKSVSNGSEVASKKIEELVNNNVYGLDIEEFPLYLAEMNILMRMLPLIINEKYNNPIDKKIKVFKTHDSIAEFQDTKLKYTLNDIEAAYVKSNGQMKLFAKKLKMDYESYVRDEDDLKEMKESLGNQKCPRRRFDFVIGNPPYVSYNECSKQGLLSFNLIKKSEMKLNDIYGVNLHSIPEHRKKYSPKPNLYAFFIALGLALLKDDGRLCYIIPQTILTAGDLDVLRYHLAKFNTIEKIITFSGKMFVGRGLKQNKPVATSSLILVVRRIPPANLHQTEIIHYKDADDDIETCLKNILENKKVNKNKILQGKLLRNVSNWNFIRQDKKFLDFHEEYKKNTDNISVYYNHATAEYTFKNKFYFDGSFNIPTKDIQKKIPQSTEFWEIPYIKSKGFLAGVDGYYPKNKKIKIAEGSQGMVMLNTSYKVIWRYVNPDKFLFIKGNDIFPRFQQFCIASNSKKEILYLLSILNSNIIGLLFDKLLTTENEKDILMGLSVIKEFVRVPKITEDNRFIKDEVIKKTEEMLALEDVKLSNLVDFSKVMMQKFEDVFAKDGYLILEKDKKQIRLKIKDSQELVEQSVKSAGKDNKLKLDDKDQINLSELKNLQVIDFNKQKELKDYIDDLIFALYFNVPVKEVSSSQSEKIKKMCEENKFYKIVKPKLISS